MLIFHADPQWKHYLGILLFGWTPVFITLSFKILKSLKANVKEQKEFSMMKWPTLQPQPSFEKFKNIVCFFLVFCAWGQLAQKKFYSSQMSHQISLQSVVEGHFDTLLRCSFSMSFFESFVFSLPSSQSLNIIRYI